MTILGRLHYHGRSMELSIFACHATTPATTTDVVQIAPTKTFAFKMVGPTFHILSVAGRFLEMVSSSGTVLKQTFGRKIDS